MKYWTIQLVGSTSTSVSKAKISGIALCLNDKPRKAPDCKLIIDESSAGGFLGHVLFGRPT